MRLLIAGCGDLGTRLGLLWCESGGSVVALRRRIEALPSCFERVAADLTQPLPAGLFCGHFDAVAYLASADARTPQAYQLAYVEGFKRLLEGLSAPVARMLFASSTAVYAEDMGGWVDETTITQPTTFNGQILMRAEQQLFELAPQATAVRLSGLYGPGRERMLALARAGDVGSPRWGNRIHIDDAARALAHVLRLQRPPKLLCVSDDQPARDDVVLAHLRMLLNLPEPVTHQPITAGTESAERGRRVSNQQLRSTGFALRYPSFAVGYAALLSQQPRMAALL